MRLAGLLFFTLLACSCQAPISGSGNISTTEKRMTHFETLKLSGNFNLKIRHSKTPKMHLITHDNLKANLDIHLHSGVLTINERNRVNSYKQYDIILSCNKISGIIAKNNTTIYVDYNDQPIYLAEYQLTDRASIEVKRANYIKFKVNLQKQASIHIEGKTKKLTLNTSQSAQFFGIHFAVDYLHVNATNNSTLKLDVMTHMSGILSDHSLLTTRPPLNRNKIQTKDHSKIQFIQTTHE